MKFSFTKNPESDFFYKESKSNIKQEGHEALNCSPEYTGQSQTLTLKSE